MAQKRYLSKIADFMTGSSRKEREEGDVDCVPPPPKRSVTAVRSTRSGQTSFRGLSMSLLTERTDYPCYAGYAVSTTMRPSEWSGLRFPVSFSARINCAITSGHDAMLTLYKLKQ